MYGNGQPLKGNRREREYLFCPYFPLNLLTQVGPSRGYIIILLLFYLRGVVQLGASQQPIFKVQMSLWQRKGGEQIKMAKAKGHKGQKIDLFTEMAIEDDIRWINSSHKKNYEWWRIICEKGRRKANIFLRLNSPSTETFCIKPPAFFFFFAPEAGLLYPWIVKKDSGRACGAGVAQQGWQVRGPGPSWRPSGLAMWLFSSLVPLLGGGLRSDVVLLVCLQVKVRVSCSSANCALLLTCTPWTWRPSPTQKWWWLEGWRCAAVAPRSPSFFFSTTDLYCHLSFR